MFFSQGVIGAGLFSSKANKTSLILKVLELIEKLLFKIGKMLLKKKGKNVSSNNFSTV